MTDNKITTFDEDAINQWIETKIMDGHSMVNG